MAIDWGKEAKAYFDNLPHPHAPSLTIGEFATAVKLATAARFGGHASPAEAALFWPAFKATGMGVEEFEHALERLAPLSFTYHGRPPSMQEIVNLKDKSPREARTYFADLPHKFYPHVSAGEMVKAIQSARPHALRHLGREPALNEAAYLHHSGANPADYYRELGVETPARSDKIQPDNVLQAPLGRHPGDRGLAPARRQAPGQ